jgi:hypothetical protein
MCRWLECFNTPTQTLAHQSGDRADEEGGSTKSRAGLERRRDGKEDAVMLTGEEEAQMGEAPVLSIDRTSDVESQCQRHSIHGSSE